MTEYCLSCGNEFVPTAQRQAQCIGCHALGKIAELEEEVPDELKIDDMSYCDYTPEDAEYQGLRRGLATASQIAREAFEEMRRETTR